MGVGDGWSEAEVGGAGGPDDRGWCVGGVFVHAELCAARVAGDC